MIITIGIGLIATLLVLANYKALRNPKIFGLALVLASVLMASGIYLILHSKGEKTFYAAFLSPFLAILLLLLARTFYRRRFGSEIIMYMYGIYPIRHEERFVTRLEKAITFLVTLISVALPILVIRLFF